MNFHRPDKQTSLAEAVALVPDEAMVGVGGLTLYRRPVALCSALAARDAATFDVVTFSAGYETELLVSAKRVRTLRTCYAGLEYFGPAPAIRRAVESGELQFVDETELTLAAGLQASVLDVPWLPIRRAIRGTDLPTVRTDFVHVDDPTTGEQLLCLPSIRPDVAVLHAAFADRAGNAVLGSSLGIDRELAFASELVIVTAEQVVEPDALPAHGEVDILSAQVDFVVHAPGGSRPCSCLPHYGYDAEALLDYVEQVGAVAESQPVVGGHRPSTGGTRT